MAVTLNQTRHRAFGAGNPLSSIRTRLDLWRTRRALARLDAHLLEDIGITPQQARHEADLTVWDVPANWTNR